MSDDVERRTNELRQAHDVLAPVYAERLAGLLDRMPIERALLGLHAELVRGSGAGTEVADLGCGTGRLLPFLAAAGLRPRGLDLSPEMVAVAGRENPGVEVVVGDLCALPYPTATLGGVVCWYSLMYLEPGRRAIAFTEIARVLAPGGHLAMAYKQGDDRRRRGGTTLGLGIGFDIWWHSEAEVAERLDAAGLELVLRAGRPAEPGEPQPQGYAIARKPIG